MQIIAMDLPEHGKRNDAAKFVPWDAVPEMARIAKYAASRWGAFSYAESVSARGFRFMHSRTYALINIFLFRRCWI